MNLNLAAIAETGAYIPFINWQYVYCYIITLFGRTCATDTIALPTVDVPSVEVVLDTASSTAQGALDATQGAGGGFWSWLWPFGGGGGGATDVAGSVASGAAGSDIGFWAGLASYVPGPIKALFNIIGSIFSFLWDLFSFVSYSISAVLLLAVLVALGGIILLRIKEWTELGTLPPRPTGKSYGWSRWQDLLDTAMSAEPKRWRESVVEADGMLGELLTKLGYHGQTTSEQMRSIPDGAFVTLPQAWEAHRIRNFIAHKSSNFILTQREAFRVMKLYEQVFEEFDFI
jgi:hypothetical protein